MAKIWLADYAAEPGFWCFLRRRFPLCRQIGELSDGTEVWLLEVPWGRDNAPPKIRKWLLRRLRRLQQAERRAGGDFRLGLPLNLAEKLAADYPEVLAAARLLSAQVLVQKAAVRQGGFAGREVGLLGVSEEWQAALVEELLQAGARVAVCGVYADRLAAAYWRRGVALPVLSARKLLQSCQTVILLRGAAALPAAGLREGRLIAFCEQQVFVEGKFSGRFAFGMFAAGMAAALRQSKKT